MPTDQQTSKRVDIRPWLRLLGATLLAAGLLAGIGYPLLRPQILALLEKLVSGDGQITASGQHTLWLLYAYLVPLALIVGALCLDLQRQARYADLPLLLTREPLHGLRRLRPSWLIMLGVPFMFSLVVTWHFFQLQKYTARYNVFYFEDGLAEWFTVLALLGAIVLLGLVLRSWTRLGQPDRQQRLIIGCYGLLVLGMFFFAGEEISWGQRIIGWETPEAFAQNDQNETNLHNFFNPYLTATERMLVLLPLAPLLGIWLEIRQRGQPLARLLLPHASLLPLSMVISVDAFFFYWRMEEPIELFVAIGLLFYGLRLFMAFRSQEDAIAAWPAARRGSAPRPSPAEAEPARFPTP